MIIIETVTMHTPSDLDTHEKAIDAAYYYMYRCDQLRLEVFALRRLCDPSITVRQVRDMMNKIVKEDEAIDLIRENKKTISKRAPHLKGEYGV